jgi:hypothetical protein
VCDDYVLGFYFQLIIAAGQVVFVAVRLLLIVPNGIADVLVEAVAVAIQAFHAHDPLVLRALQNVSI